MSVWKSFFLCTCFNLIKATFTYLYNIEENCTVDLDTMEVFTLFVVQYSTLTHFFLYYKNIIASS